MFANHSGYCIFPNETRLKQFLYLYFLHTCLSRERFLYYVSLIWPLVERQDDYRQSWSWSQWYHLGSLQKSLGYLLDILPIFPFRRIVNLARCWTPISLIQRFFQSYQMARSVPLEVQYSTSWLVSNHWLICCRHSIFLMPIDPFVCIRLLC